jgi:hypothetical protein
VATMSPYAESWRTSLAIFIPGMRAETPSIRMGNAEQLEIIA